jgi:hypothetical protein
MTQFQNFDVYLKKSNAKTMLERHANANYPAFFGKQSALRASRSLLSTLRPALLLLVIVFPFRTTSGVVGPPTKVIE